jgi:cytochrome P450
MKLSRRRYGPTFTVRIPPRGIAFFTEPEPIRQIFAARADAMHAGEFNAILRAVVGPSSVLLLDEASHMRQRKLLLPPFHGERMRLYGAVMQDATRRSIERWPRDTPFALHPHMQGITLDIILRTVFGVEEGPLHTELHDQLRRLLSLGDVPVSPLVLFLLSSRPERERRAPWSWILRDRDRTDVLVHRQIAARRAEGPRGAERSDVLSLLLEAKDEHGAPMTNDEIRDELVTALVAGHETTATALCWAFERLLSSPRVLDRLLEEIEGAANGSLPAPEDIARLPYLDATIKEVLRLRPVVPVVGRVVKRPETIGGYDFSPGDYVGACIYLAHRNPDTYPDPETFRPERFLDMQPDPAAFLPFGGGLRRCLGAAFAVYEMKIALATILSMVEVKLAQPSPIRVVRRAITFSPENGVRVRAEPRPVASVVQGGPHAA